LLQRNFPQSNPASIVKGKTDLQQILRLTENDVTKRLYCKKEVSDDANGLRRIRMCSDPVRRCAFDGASRIFRSV
jgi:hypothetical protein